MLPYKSKVANALEIAVQLNFLTLLVLETAPLFQDTLFIFPAPSEQDLERGIAKNVWIVQRMPAY